MVINIDKKIINNQEVAIINVENKCGLKATFLSLGAAFYSCSLMNKIGQDVNILVAPKSLDDYANKDYYFGKTIGRVAGRIDNGVLSFEGININLEKNWNNISFLHGGSKGVSNQNFSYKINEKNDYSDIIFSTKILEENDSIPGDISFETTYRIYNTNNMIKVIYNYSSNKDTIASFTNHACFNLNGTENVLNHQLMICSSKCGDLDDNLITKQLVSCNPIMNFSKPKKIGEFIGDESLQNHTAKGYDHPYVFDDDKKVVLSNDDGSIILALTTTYPATVIYSNNYPTDYVLLSGEKDHKYAGICIEPSFYPNSISDMKIEKNKEYTEEIVYIFYTK